MAKKKEAAKPVEPLKPINISMDEIDLLKVENIVLKERNFELEKDKSHNELYAGLVKKYKVDLTKFGLIIDAQNKKLVLTPK